MKIFKRILFILSLPIGYCVAGVIVLVAVIGGTFLIPIILALPVAAWYIIRGENLYPGYFEWSLEVYCTCSDWVYNIWEAWYESIGEENG